MNILGAKVDNLAKKEILEKIEIFLREDNPSTIQGKVLGKFHQIATINPEFILQAQKDEEFKNILNSCDLNVADGAGIWFAFLWFGKYLKSRMTGADLMEEILKIASANNHKIFLVASDRGLSGWEETRNAILKRYPNLEIDGVNFNCHSERVKRVEESNKKELDPSAPRSLSRQKRGSAQDDIEKISVYDIVFCNFGAPEQEKFLYSLKSLKSDKIRLAMGVGGSFDFITGKIKRAPVFMRKLGLEWLWRLIQQPKRIKRIWNAVIIFPIKVLINGK